jgi:hypothetical protein
MKAGFHEIDITPRVGVELCGFGPFLNRKSIAVKDNLKARAVAFQLGNEKALIVSCDLIGLSVELVSKIKQDIASKSDLTPANIMVHCTHTHSGPNTGNYLGWGEGDLPYLEILPGRIVKTCLTAIDNIELVEVFHAKSACEGIGLNREYDIDAPPLEEVLNKNWRPAKPELTDTICHIIKFISTNSGKISGFITYFGCHPVVCCQKTRYIHGDFCGVALNNLEREYSGSVGLFLQGAQGDVNSCVVHKPEEESLKALDIIAERFAKSIRNGLEHAKKLNINSLKSINIMQKFSTKAIPIEKLKELLKEREAIVYADDASDENHVTRMAVIGMISIRGMINRMESGDDMIPTAELQGIKLGPLEFLAGPFEIMQAIKNEVNASAKIEIPLVMGITNGALGYAMDKTVAARGGYTAEIVPIIAGMLPYANIHEELVEALLELDKKLN